MWLEAVSEMNKKGHIFGVGLEAPDISYPFTGVSVPLSLRLYLDFQTKLQQGVNEQETEATTTLMEMIVANRACYSLSSKQLPNNSV